MAMTNAERQAAWRERMKAKLAAAAEPALSESAKARFDRLLAKATSAKIAALEATYEKDVREAARAQLPQEAEALRAAKEKANAEFKKYVLSRQGIAAQLSEEDYRFLLNVLHPDRAPADRRDKFARAFDIVRKLDAYIAAFKGSKK